MRMPSSIPVGRLFAALCLCLVVHAAQARGGKDQSWWTVDSPHFGEVLFDFYQDHYFTALTHLLAAEQGQRVGQRKDEAELLRGGLYLSYGLHTEAGRIFQQLIDQGAPQPVRDRAWFYLAKIRYQRGYADEAQEALGHIAGTLPGELEDERQVLAAQLLMARQQYPEAIRLLKSLRGDSEWIAYGRFNLGVALIKYGMTAEHLSANKDEGVNLLAKVGYMPARTQEMRALRDKANLALGYFFLQEGTLSTSKAYFNEVRLDGPLSNKALLGVGWGYASEEKVQEALVPWLELQQRDPTDIAVQESLLAVPYAYGRLGAYKESLQGYEAAIATYEKELDRLKTSIAAIRAGKMATNVLQHDAPDESGWLWELHKLPDTPENRYLLQLMAGNEFQEALKNYRDLRFLQANLNHWSDNLGVFTDILTTRRDAYRKRLPGVQQALANTDLTPQKKARDAFAAEIGRIERENDAFAVLPLDQQQLLLRLAQIDGRLRSLADQPGIKEAQEKYRLLSGVYLWNVNRDFVPRLWLSQKELNGLNAALDESEKRKQALVQAQARAAQAFEGYDARIAAVRERIARAQARIVSVALAQERRIEELAVAELEQRQQRVAGYLTQARFAVAQIYDQATHKQVDAP
jgi:hypothetical protein